MIALSDFWTFLASHFPSLAAIVAIGGGLFASVKWYDIRNRELRQQNWNDYQEALDIVWGRDLQGQDISAARQLAAIYRLTRFPEFYLATVIALEEAGERNPVSWKQDVGPHATRIVKVLKKTHAYKRQARKFGLQKI
jgi:hypothetical protein